MDRYEFEMELTKTSPVFFENPCPSVGKIGTWCCCLISSLLAAARCEIINTANRYFILLNPFKDITGIAGNPIFKAEV